MKIGVIGMGWVGSSVAISTLHTGVASELLLNDVREEVAEGEAMDLQHGAAFLARARVRSASIEEMATADAVVITAGRGGKPGQSRLELLQQNAVIARDIARRLRGTSAVVLVVTNPVDVLTQLVAEECDLPPGRVIGTGTMLETARLREIAAQRLELHPRSIHAQVVGEHGDSNVVLWSSAHVGGRALRDYPGWTTEMQIGVDKEVRRAAYEIIQRKGATNHAIGLVTAHLLKWTLRDERRIVTVSSVQSGACGVSDVALSLPAIVGRQGAVEIVTPEMNAEEREALARSADVLRRARDSIT
jgi:L-lactate dehydrogenase